MGPTWLAKIGKGPRRVNHAAVIRGRHMFVIGGYYTGLLFRPGHPADVCVLSLDELTWKRLEVDALDAPFMRYGHTAILFNHEIYVWGGRNDLMACDKLFKLEIRAGRRRWHIVPTTGEAPRARDGHAACLIDSKMYIFGGYLDEPHNVFATGLYYVDLETFEWHRVFCKGPEPACRDFHSMVSFEGKLYLFGGRGTDTPPYHSDQLYYPEDLHIWTEKTSTWSVRCRGVDGPVGRRSLSMFLHNRDIYIFGGFNAALRCHFNDLHKYSIDNEKWTRVKPRGQPPCPRRRQSCLVYGNRIFIFGGTSPIRPSMVEEAEDETQLRDHNDLYILDLTPSLRSLCLKVVANKCKTVDYMTVLPANLAAEVRSMDPRTERLRLHNEFQPILYTFVV